MHPSHLLPCAGLWTVGLLTGWLWTISCGGGICGLEHAAVVTNPTARPMLELPPLYALCHCSSSSSSTGQGQATREVGPLAEVTGKVSGGQPELSALVCPPATVPFHSRPQCPAMPLVQQVSGPWALYLAILF